MSPKSFFLFLTCISIAQFRSVIFADAAGEWQLVIVHSNDLWYQLDEIQADDKPCYVDLPPVTSTTTPKPTEASTTPTSTTTAESTKITESTLTTQVTTPTTSPITPSTATQTTSMPTAVSNETEPTESWTTKNLGVLDRDTTCYGGVPRHQSKVTQFRQTSASAGKSFLHLNAGSMLGGYIWYPILGHEPMTEAMLDLKYDAVALGYRDFDEGVHSTVKYLKKLQELKIDVLCANINTTKEPSMDGLYKRSITRTLQGRKIGIIGYIGTDADYLADTGKITFEDEITALKREAGNLLKDGVTFIIALGSTSLDRARTLLQDANLADIDLFVNGGGKSSLLWNGQSKGPLNEPVSGPYPITSNIQQLTRLLVQTSRYGKYLGMLDMEIDDQGHIKQYSTTNPTLLDSSIPQDPNLQDKVDNWEREVLTQSNEVIGYTKTPIYSDRKYCWYEECNGGSLMADAALWYLSKNQSNTQEWANSPAAAVWHGGALSDTDLDIGPGDIKFGDILYMFPYANTIALATMKGWEVKKLFENSVEYYKSGASPNRGEFLHVSGFKVEYDLNKPPGSRVKSLYIRDTSSVDGGMNPVKDEVTYKIGMPSFIARGGTRYSFMESIYHVETELRDEYVLKDYIKLMSPLAYGREGRILFFDGVNPDCPKTDVTGTVFLTIFLTLLFAGLIFACYKYLYPKLRDRRGSLLSLVRMNSLPRQTL